MPRTPRRTLCAMAATLPLLAAVPAVAQTPPRRAPAVTLTGTYEVLAVDHENAEGGLTHDYREVLRVPGRNAVAVRLPAGHGLTAGTKVAVSAQPTGDATAYGSTYDVTSVRRLAPASTLGSPGVTSVLVILAYWTKPDSVTRTRAHQQFFDEDDKWYREVSYGKAGLAGVVTPWVKIPAPRNGLCLADAEVMLANAQVKAAALGATYDPARYNRTVLYFPRCTGGDSDNIAGWAYEPGTVSWLNGTMDKRTTVHEQGHNFGMGHARAFSCKSTSGARVTFSRSCVVSEYGDAFDAMGRSTYGAHFTGYRKDQAGWLAGGRKRTLTTSSSTFTLPPFEKPATNPNVVVALSPSRADRSYWLEYRRPVGMDARLPPGATAGVLIHVKDGGRFGLLDLSPRDATASTAVLEPGESWTAPDYVRFTVGYMSSSGARVTVTGAKPAPKAPSAPRYVVAKAGDGNASVSWQPPSSTGGAPLTEYHVRAVNTVTRAVREVFLDATELAATLNNLANGATYDVTVRARNGMGWGAGATTTVKPVVMNPTVRLLTPAAGETVYGSVTFTAAGTPHPVTESPVSCYRYVVDGENVGINCSGHDTDIHWSSARYADGDHTVQVYATDIRGREGTSGPRTIKVRNAFPSVSITSPVPGTYDAMSLKVSADAVPEAGTTIGQVAFYDVTNGRESHIGFDTTAPYEMSWHLGWDDGTRSVVAVARTTTGLETRSAPVSVQVVRPRPTVAVTSPAPGATVSGTRATLTADAASHTTGASVRSVEFYVNGTHVGSDSTAPYTATWDISRVSGTRSVTARVYEDSWRSVDSAPVSVTVANVLPAVRIRSPLTYSQTYPGRVTVSGTATAGTGGVAPDRVEVKADGRLLGTVVPAADGTWSTTWDATYASLGWHYLTATAFTPEGLAAASNEVAVVVQYPEPTFTVETPADGALIVGGSSVEVVAGVVPHQYATARVVEVCASTTYFYRCTSAPAADGKYRIPWTVTEPSGHRSLRVAVSLSDGHTRALYRSITVARPPKAPGLTVHPRDGGVWVTVTAPTAYEPVPVLGYTVNVGGTPYEVGVGTFAVQGLTNGTAYDVSAVARNAAGTGAVATAVVTPMGSTMLEWQTLTTSVRWGEEFSGTALLTMGEDAAPAPGETVEMWECGTSTDGSCDAMVATGVTGADGLVTLSYVPRQLEPRLEARFPGRTGKHPAVTSRYSLTMSANVTATLSPTTVAYGSTATIRGTVQPGTPGTDSVVLQRRVSDGTWQRVTEATLSSAHTVSFPVKYGRGTWRFRLQLLGWELQGESNEVVLTVV